ncbi:unnamed protein product [Brachionus calyciflorus]|uniref:non-specific serine/threonine protein kinase n=1 Tax=Brachionus calyciflorus TaxID=104777 RepID=A0A813RKH2_9BILA|nr:unnamed protein product [Brachionus calyciflorus]
MFFEIERVIDENELNTNDNIIKSYITLAIVENVDENGQLKYKIPGLDDIYSIEPCSNLIHPCGFWNYFYTEIKQKMDMSEYNDRVEFKVFDLVHSKYLQDSIFNWNLYFKTNNYLESVSFDIFSQEQKEEMPRFYYAQTTFIVKNYLTCDFTYNPRYIWSSLEDLSSDDMTSIFQNLGMFKQVDDLVEEVTEETLSAIVLLPKKIDKNFISVPSIKSIDCISNLNASCIHRENIKLFIQNQSFININYPHLLEGKCLDLIEENVRLSLKDIIILFCTCLDIRICQNDILFPNFKLDENFNKEKFNQSLKQFYNQLSSCLSLIIPYFYEAKFRLDKSIPIKDIIIDESLKNFKTPQSSETSLQSPIETNHNETKLQDFVSQKIKEFSISSNGMCKYCNVFNLDLSSLSLKQGASLDNFFKKALKQLDEFSSIITSINIRDSLDLTISDPKSISLSRKIFKYLPNLVTITLNNVKISEIHTSINNTEFLKNIEFQNNYLLEIPDDILTKNKSLTQIIIDNQPIREIPYSLFCLKNLKSLVLSRLNLEKLPVGWNNEDNCTNIKSLVISECKLENLPDDLISKNPSIEELTFQGVNLALLNNENQCPISSIELDKVIEMYCPNLLSLDEARALFTRFDADKNNFLDDKELQSFNAYIFKNFPRAKEITYTKTITYLDLSFQAIRKISDDIEIMENLKVLKLKYCVYLESLSAKLGDIKLNELDLTGCLSLKTPPLEIQRRGVNSVLAYLKRLLTGSVVCKRTKLMLLGLGGAGKTSLIEALMNNVLQNGNVQPPNLTDGISILDWNVNLDEDQTLAFSVFDFAGQVVYYNTHQFFLTKRSIYILVWNVRLGAEHSGLDFWLNSIDCHAPSCPIFIVGTHIDEVSKFDLPIEKYKKKYEQIVGFHFVSSYDGKGISELSQALIDAALKEKYMGEKIPKCWLDFENKLHEIKREKYFLEYHEVEKLGENYGIFDQSELAQALVFLHDLGSIMYFNNQFLRDKVVINPQFMVDLLACVVSVNNMYIENGQLWNHDVDKIWKKYNPSLHTWILKITEKFDLTFEIPEKGLHLVPCLLSETPPSEVNLNETFSLKQTTNTYYSTLDSFKTSSKKETITIYNFEYLPIGLFNRAQVRLFLLTDSNTMWKNGSIIRKNNHVALITRKENVIEVKCSGIQPENLIFLIHEVIETLIAESFNGVNYDFSFPCPDCFDSNAINTEKSMFSASLVRQATRKKAVFLQCRNSFHVVPILDLHSKMPPDSIDTYDIQLKNSVRDLKHLKKKISTDIVILYSTKDLENDSIIKPRQIKIDLEKNGFDVWFSETPDTTSIDSISLLIRNCSLVLFCITDNFCSDTRCTDLFNFVKITILKPYVLVVLGESFEWQKTQVGALITNEFFIKINTITRYQTSLPDLIDLTTRKINVIRNKKTKKNENCQCFISYCRVNSQDAINKGTPLRNKESIGWGDPRELKEKLVKAGFSVWIDYEQVGNKKNLFDDIVEGVRNCSIFIACISNEYALSENCMKEFRFASNLKKPILMCTFGSAHRKSEWKSTELGIISCLNNKEINFQLENPKAYEDVFSELKNLKIIPVLKNPVKNDEDISDETGEESNQAYTELIELTQRKFLRQVASFSDSATSQPFPRLIIIDLPEDFGLNFMNANYSSINNSGNLFSSDYNSTNMNVSPIRSSLNLKNISSSSSKRKSEKFSPYRSQGLMERFCLRVACEHESGWHPSGMPIEYESLKNIPTSHISYLFRIMSIVKHSELSLDILKNQEKYQDLINQLEDALNSSTNIQSNQTSTPSRYSSSTYDTVNVSSFKDSYSALKNFILHKLNSMLFGVTKNLDKTANLNRLDHFELNRCSLPSGKIVWLCDEHSREEHVQILTSIESVNFSQFQNDEFNAILFEELKKYDQ